MVIDIDDKILNDIKINLYNCHDTLNMIKLACILEYDFTFSSGPISIVMTQLTESIKIIDQALGTNNCFSQEELEYEQ